jgi:hypothetical protein
MVSPEPAPGRIPDWLRWAALIWLLVWFPAYWHTWGAANFLQLCDLAVILTSIGLWTNSALLISSQAVSSLLIDLVWALDAGWRLFVGRHLMGGTEYLFDRHYPAWVRLLSLFHVLMPTVLLWALLRIGYDRRAYRLQCAIAFLALLACRFTSPQKNMNFAFRDPFLHRPWGPPPIHLAISTLALAIAVYLPTHLLLRRLFTPAGSCKRSLTRR